MKIVHPETKREVLIIGIIVPIIEELIFRGFLLGKYKGTNSERKGLVIISLIFFAVHFDFSIIILISSFILGTIFLLTDLRYSIKWHIINNTIVQLNQISKDNYIIAFFIIIIYFSNCVIGLKYLYDYYKKRKLQQKKIPMP